MERYKTYWVHRKKPVKKRKFSINIFKSTTSYQYFALMLLIIVGAVIGAFYIQQCGVQKSSLNGTGFFIQDLLSQQTARRGFIASALSAFFPIAALLSAAFILGLCAIGMPFEAVIVMLFGLWTGSCMSIVYTRYGIKGFGICLLFILPQTIINSVALLVASREGFRFSVKVSKVIFKGDSTKLDAPFKQYCYKYIVCFILVIMASLIQAIAIKIFSIMFFT